jgi:hypothetical protein
MDVCVSALCCPVFYVEALRRADHPPKESYVCERSRNGVIDPVLQFGGELPRKGARGRKKFDKEKYHIMNTSVFRMRFLSLLH